MPACSKHANRDNQTGCSFNVTIVAAPEAARPRASVSGSRDKVTPKTARGPGKRQSAPGTERVVTAITVDTALLGRARAVDLDLNGRESRTERQPSNRPPSRR
jgi:hypothetical protein